jgi:hypothetical protein
MSETFQRELQDETGILISYDKKKKRGWKEDRMSQLKKGNGAQMEDTTRKIYHIHIKCDIHFQNYIQELHHVPKHENRDQGDSTTKDQTD